MYTVRTLVSYPTAPHMLGHISPQTMTTRTFRTKVAAWLYLLLPARKPAEYAQVDKCCMDLGVTTGDRAAAVLLAQGWALITLGAFVFGVALGNLARWKGL